VTQYAPVVICTYTRINHLKKTIDALLKNDLASKTTVFVFSDCARAGDEQKVDEVRTYLAAIRGFDKLNIVPRKCNVGSVANCVGGLAEVLGKHGRAIFLEDDIVSAPGFLSFMNQALDQYETNERIFSICGYCPPIRIPEDYTHDLFMLRRFNAWGFGIWKNRFDSVLPISPEEYKQFAAKKEQVRLFLDGGGKDMMDLLKANAYGEIDAFDVKAMYTQFLKDQYTIYPTTSLTSNIGMDGTGVHCGNTRRFDVELSGKTSFSLPDNPSVDHRIVKENQRFRARNSFARRFAGKLRRTFKRMKATVN
jgi:hypothetical protein